MGETIPFIGRLGTFRDMTEPVDPVVSIVLADMDRTELAVYGFRSWILQDYQQPYEVVLVLLNSRAPDFERLALDRNPLCDVRIHSYERPNSFNISAANNLGLHHASGTYVFFSNSDVVYPSHYLRSVAGDLERHSIAYAAGRRMSLSSEVTRNLPPVTMLKAPGDFDYLGGSPGKAKYDASPWMVLRDVAYEVGGFDPGLRCFEDSDFSERVMYRLRQQGVQDCLIVMGGVSGYHLDHPYSDLYSFSESGHVRISERQRILYSGQDDSAWRLATPLDSLQDLLNDLYSCEVMPNSPSLGQAIQSRIRRSRVLRRGVRAGRVLLGREGA